MSLWEDVGQLQAGVIKSPVEAFRIAENYLVSCEPKSYVEALELYRRARRDMKKAGYA